jgi:hypothetical protein
MVFLLHCSYFLLCNFSLVSSQLTGGYTLLPHMCVDNVYIPKRKPLHNSPSKSINIFWSIWSIWSIINLLRYACFGLIMCRPVSWFLQGLQIYYVQMQTCNQTRAPKKYFYTCDECEYKSGLPRYPPLFGKSSDFFPAILDMFFLIDLILSPDQFTLFIQIMPNDAHFSDPFFQ